MTELRGYDLDGAIHDTPPTCRADQVRRSYLLCSTPRSGSSLLSEALHATGRLGTPLEYFDPDGSYAAISRRWGTTDLLTYVRLLHRRRATPDGILGVKLHWPQLVALAAALDGHHGDDVNGAIVDVITWAFPAPRFLHLYRRDRDRQAVSLAIARQTGRWSLIDGDDGEPTGVRYSRQLIEDCRRELDEQERHWEALFTGMGVAPHAVAYEDLVTDYEDVVRGAAAFLGLDLAGEPVPPPRLRRQADDRTDCWLARLAADRRG